MKSKTGSNNLFKSKTATLSVNTKQKVPKVSLLEVFHLLVVDQKVMVGLSRMMSTQIIPTTMKLLLKT